MATQEWVVSDNSIWDYDYSDDFIWIPSSAGSGQGMWVAFKDKFTFIANRESFQFVANKD